MKPSNETLMAYADGELSAADRAAVETAIEADPQVAQQVELYRAQRDRLRAAFGDVLEEPVPERLIAAAHTAPTAGNNVTNFSDAHAAHRRKKAQRQWSWPEWTAIAASLIAGAFLSQSLMRSSGDAIVARDGGLAAQGILAEALSNQLASEPATGKAVQVVLSYRDKSGNYCRSFVMQDGSALAGAACRDNDAWRINVLAKNDAPVTNGGNYRMAGTALPSSVLQAIDAQMEGEPLDTAGEAAARRHGWR